MIHNFGYGEPCPEPTTAERLGGKGASLLAMTADGLRVPPGFIFPTYHCQHWASQQSATQRSFYIAELVGRAMVECAKITEASGKGASLLWSVRSGAPVSMPGMMDTILNVGMNPSAMPFWEKRLGAVTARQCMHRLASQLASAVGASVPQSDVDWKHPTTATSAIEAAKSCFEMADGTDFPAALAEQLSVAITAVLKSWTSERAVAYRRANGIDDAVGTAVIVQRMVFGNLNAKSGTGVLFTRDPSTGEDAVVGEWLAMAQGEDVVAGTHTPRPLSEMADEWPEVHAELCTRVHELERARGDVQDVEFTVEDGRLYFLQTRAAKRSARAAFRVARDMVKAELIPAKQVRRLIQPRHVTALGRPEVDPAHKAEPVARGLAASPGVARGVLATDLESLQVRAATGLPVILARRETSPDDYNAMLLARGVLTQRGGLTSHAAVVARSMGLPCVTACASLEFQGGLVGFGGVQVPDGNFVTICGDTGRVWLGEVPTITPDDACAREVMGWLGAKDEGLQVVDVPTKDGGYVYSQRWLDMPPEQVLASFDAVRKHQKDVVLDCLVPLLYENHVDAGAPQRLVRKRMHRELLAAFFGGSKHLGKLRVIGDCDGVVDTRGAKMYGIADAKRPRPGTSAKRAALVALRAGGAA